MRRNEMKDYKITEIRFEKILGIDYFERSIIVRQRKD